VAEYTSPFCICDRPPQFAFDLSQLNHGNDDFCFLFDSCLNPDDLGILETAEGKRKLLRILSIMLHSLPMDHFVTSVAFKDESQRLQKEWNA
jgi:hypothetical protein